MTKPVGFSSATPQSCNECNGTGLGKVVPRCCRRSDWECGARGCTGPEPEQEPCERCGGAGVMPELNYDVEEPQE